MRPLSDCCIVYEINPMVFVFPVGRTPLLTRVIWEKENWVRKLHIPFCLGTRTSLMVQGFRGKGPRETSSPTPCPVVESLREPGTNIHPGASEQAVLRKLGGSLAMAGSLYGEVWIPRVQATERFWGGELSHRRRMYKASVAPEFCLTHLFSPK